MSQNPHNWHRLLAAKKLREAARKILEMLQTSPNVWSLKCISRMQCKDFHTHPGRNVNDWWRNCYVCRAQCVLYHQREKIASAFERFIWLDVADRMYLHFVFGERMRLLCCCVFFVVTVECSRLKFTPSACLHFAATVACNSNSTIENHKVSLPELCVFFLIRSRKNASDVI